MTMRTVTLELLRHGPAHNQLLSPLTPYLALCGNHDAETVQVGLEHLHFLRVRESLDYTHGNSQALYGLQDAAREVSRLLESIRSLTAELASSEPTDGRRIHLRLVLSASELALLPFELATSHTGMPGQGQPLCLQTVVPVSLTREVRRVPATTLEWPRRPRVLLVTAAPRCVSEVPVREHLEAIKDALSPYVQDVNDPRELSQRLTVLAEATLEEVADACSNNSFTHVHVLAHGIAYEGTGREASYGLAFHKPDNRDEVDIVSGERLALALRCHQKSVTEEALSSPAVVTIASCFSASLGGVIAPGASIAHALHEQGVPLVVGSQFPLTFKGSILMAQVLYRRLFAGDDPRSIVHDLRQELYTGCPESHDWASVVTYAAFPDSLQQQLEDARFEQAREALHVRMSRVKALVSKAHELQEAGDPRSDRALSLAREFKALQRGLLEAMERFEATAPKRAGGSKQVQAWGMLASARKQVAFLLCVDTTEDGVPFMQPREASRLREDEDFCNTLRKARLHYYECYKVGSKEAWPLVQYLSLTTGLGLHVDPRTSKVSTRFKRLWHAAVARARENLLWGTPKQKLWAHSSLAELSVLAMLWRTPGQQARCKRDAHRHIRQARHIRDIGLYEGAGFDLNSQFRQFRRYEWWGWGTPAMRALCNDLVEEPDKETRPVTKARRSKRKARAG